jgi:formylglycine-generating enzyme required for sulfatase activity
MDNLANFESSHIGDTTPVARHGKSSMSPFGLLDLLGNVYEWTATLHTPSHLRTENLPLISILKGGSWSSKKGITTASRLLESNTWSNIIGFRCAV